MTGNKFGNTYMSTFCLKGFYRPGVDMKCPCSESRSHARLPATFRFFLSKIAVDGKIIGFGHRIPETVTSKKEYEKGDCFSCIFPGHNRFHRPVFDVKMPRQGRRFQRPRRRFAYKHKFVRHFPVDTKFAFPIWEFPPSPALQRAADPRIFCLS